MRGTLGVIGCLLRGAIAAYLVYLCAGYLPQMGALDELERLPDFDYRAEAQSLFSQERWSEALLVIDAGLQATVDPLADLELEKLRDRVVDARDAWGRRLADVGRGALTGRGDSIESLGGAVVADVFVFGDIRDLVIQGANAIAGEEVDEVIVALSAAGLVLTVAPAVDAGAALLKFARRLGALTESFARSIARLARGAVAEGRTGPLLDVLEDSGRLLQHARPGPALRILRNADDVDDLALAARYVERPGGAFTLWLAGKPGLSFLKTAGRGGAQIAGRSADDVLAAAARKGRPGLEWLERNRALLLRPHPLTGLVKGIYKGNVPALLGQAMAQYAAPVLGMLVGWLLVEVLLLGARGMRMWRNTRPA